MTPAPEHVRFAAELRLLRDRTGLSLSGLAAKTAYSRSSWERYLNGRTLPPRQAVRELCQLAGEPEGRALALWEIAESGWSGRAREAPKAAAGTAPTAGVPPPGETATGGETADRTAPGPSPEPGRTDLPSGRLTIRAPSPAGHRAAALMAVLATVCAVAVGGVTVALLLLTRDQDEPRAAAPPPSPSVSSSPHPHCRGVACEGRSPMVTKCGAQPDTLARRRMSTGAWVEVRYNRRCGASWARTWGARIGDGIELSVSGTGHPVRRAEIEDDVDTDSFVYTPMTVTPAGTVVRACFRPARATGKECFDTRVAG